MKRTEKLAARHIDVVGEVATAYGQNLSKVAMNFLPFAITLIGLHMEAREPSSARVHNQAEALLTMMFIALLDLEKVPEDQYDLAHATFFPMLMENAKSMYMFTDDEEELGQPTVGNVNNG